MKKLLLGIFLFLPTFAFAGGGGQCYDPNVVAQYFDQLNDGTDDCGVYNLTNHGVPAYITTSPQVFFQYVAFGLPSDVNYLDSTALGAVMLANKASWTVDACFWMLGFTDNMVAWCSDQVDVFGLAGVGENKFRFLASGAESIGTYSVVVGHWYHVTWSWDGTTRRVWYSDNGGPEYQDTITNSTSNGAFGAGTTKITIGHWSGGNNYRWNGYTNHMRFWKKGLLAPPPVDLSLLKPMPVLKLRNKGR